MVDLQRELGVQPGSRCQALQLYALLYEFGLSAERGSPRTGGH